MRFSILTPVHPASARWLTETYDSLRDQAEDWEWVLLLNGGLESVDLPDDERVRIIQGPAAPSGIGTLKRLCALQATGEVLVELDADDLLVPNALSWLGEAFEEKSVQFVYSNDASFSEDGGAVAAYDRRYGWITRPYVAPWGATLNEMVAWPPSAQMMRSIWWAPDHVRAWRRSAYWELGGHDSTLSVGDDHDLCYRTYLRYGAAGMRHIDRCLYLYRIRGDNTHIVRAEEIQAQWQRNYLKYSRDAAVRWARDHGLALLDLGGRFGAWDGFVTVDLFDADVVCDLAQPWPFAEGSVGVLKAHHIFEHLPDPIHAMNEAFRVLAPGGWLLLEVPSTEGRGAWQDPTHVSFWNENSIRYYTDERWARYIRPGWRGRFQNARTVTYDPFNDPTVPVVQADLIAVKGDYALRPAGEVL